QHCALGTRSKVYFACLCAFVCTMRASAQQGCVPSRRSLRSLIHEVLVRGVLVQKRRPPKPPKCQCTLWYIKHGTPREPRLELNLSPTLCGMDASGRSFLESVTIHNISGNGLLVENKRNIVDAADIVVVRFGHHKARFKVAWVYASPTNGHQWLGLRHVAPTN